ncbi:MAG: hypothetical protein KF910_09215 [Brevundimonas sp.]|uniref:hypothetical protein n=1 Tax=Brevundimonas sp. TaxID=1871086 RepID=UPI0025B84590|nr:hypothetical protein [Brevundimonas sp.]MBX3477776.1 hypothetical protein [Brevundimonas sp.]
MSGGLGLRPDLDDHQRFADPIDEPHPQDIQADEKAGFSARLLDQKSDVIVQRRGLAVGTV